MATVLISPAAKLATWIRSLEERSIPLGDDKWETVVLLALDVEQRDLVLRLLDREPITVADRR